MEAGAAEEQPG